MRTTRRRSLIVGTMLSLAGLLLVPTTAGAAGPEHGNFSGTATNVDLCGFTTTLTFRGVDNFFPVFDSSGNIVAFKDTHQERDVYTAANGKSVVDHFVQQVTATFTANPDGTTTFVATYKGLPEQLSTPNGPVLTQDVGLATIVYVFDSSDNLISVTPIVEHGPHPDLGSGFSLFCQVVTAALS
jgi:hypothetical protein